MVYLMIKFNLVSRVLLAKSNNPILVPTPDLLCIGHRWLISTAPQNTFSPSPPPRGQLNLQPHGLQPRPAKAELLLMGLGNLKTNRLKGIPFKHSWFENHCSGESEAESGNSDADTMTTRT